MRESGWFMNPDDTAFRQERKGEIYVDKTALISFCNGRLATPQKYICVSRPRRFGKTVTADMLTAYYSEGCSSEDLFEGLSIFGDPSFSEHLNQYHVIKLDMHYLRSVKSSVDEMLDYLRKVLLRELKLSFPDVELLDPESLVLTMADVYRETHRLFVVIIDEWDCLFREYRHDQESQKKYLDFLRNLLKDKPYIGLCYMTGILPIKKYGTHSALNMFTEYSMEYPGKLAEFVGFTEMEVKSLCQQHGVDFRDCNTWYNGYFFPQCGRVYNPNSIVRAIEEGRFSDYWNQTETYEALKIYVDMNFRGLKDIILKLMAGDKQKISTSGFQNDMTTFTSVDDVLTLLIHLGYLGYDSRSQEVFIPNEEIRQEFVTATKNGEAWEKVAVPVRQSDDLLKATLRGDEQAVAKGIEQVHLETSHLQYNDENALSYTVSLAYYSARMHYQLVREMPTGKGFADIVFLPRKREAGYPAMIVELKWDQSADTAIRQIEEKEYPRGLEDYRGNLLLVGISYDRKSRKHSCRIVRR